MFNSHFILCAATAAMLIGCGRGPSVLPVYIDGRAVESLGDTLLGLTYEGTPGLLILNTRSGELDTLGAGVLVSPFHTQWLNGRWYVSDVEAGRPAIVVFSGDGTLERRLDLGDMAATPHQFAVLPDGRIVVETRDRELVVVHDDSVTTFALTEGAMRTGVLVAADGGLLHAIPDHSLTLYNAFGNIRWRVEWPWLETAFVSDVSIDSRGRPHVIAGTPRQGEGAFVVYTMAKETGEVTRWSEPGPYATFVVDFFGEVRPDSTDNWIVE